MLFRKSRTLLFASASASPAAAVHHPKAPLAAGCSSSSSHGRAAGSGSGSSSSSGSAIDIRLANHYHTKIYTPGAPILGEAVIHVHRDTHFDRIALQFVGLVSTRNYMTPVIDQVLHHFLLMDMPLEISTSMAAAAAAKTSSPLHPCIPADGVLRAGHVYVVPFFFVVPHRLPLGACRQHCEHPSVREQHLRLPPSVGNWPDGRDDDSPDTARVEYAVCVSVLQKGGGGGLVPSESISALRSKREIKVLPTYPQDAPLSIERGVGKKSDNNYKLVASKFLRRTLLSRRLASLVAEAVQPPAVTLACHGGVSSTEVVVPLHLLVSPTASQQQPPYLSDEAFLHQCVTDRVPPRAIAASARLVTKTYFSTVHMRNFADCGRRHDLDCSTPLYYETSSSWTRVACEPLTTWQPCRSPPAPAAPTTTTTTPAWSRRFALRLKLPVKHDKKMLLPTFHSCIVSRTYTLRISICFTPAASNITLHVPLQIIIAEESPSPQAQTQTAATTAAAADAGCRGGDVRPGRRRQGTIEADPPKYRDHMFVPLDDDELGRCIAV